jgi:2-polyprenyl-6-methoxyphenol hydroxylase-like FAD-dependent oxidoreductase
MRSPPTAGIIGSGIAGLSAALALRQAGYLVSLFEQADELAPMGAALSIWENAFLCLRELGAATMIERQAAPILQVSVHDANGRQIMKPVSSPLDHDNKPHAFLPTRTLLQSALLDALGEDLPRLNCRIARTRQDANSAYIETDDGEVHRFDLVIAADGIRSSTGQALTGTTARHAGYGGLLALSDGVENSEWPQGELREYWAVGERFGAGDLGQHRNYWFYMRNEDQAGQWSRLPLPELQKRLANWPSEVRQILKATRPECLIPFSIHDRAVPKRLGEGRIICAGDAAHAMQPNLGQGGCQSIEDALALREAARRSPPEAVVVDYSKKRLNRAQMLVRSSAGAGRICHFYSQPITKILHRTARLVPSFINRTMLLHPRTLPDYF